MTVKQSKDDALPQPPLVEMVFLGTASMVTSSTRHVSGVGVVMGGDCWIFDAGEGTGVQLAKSSVLQSAVSRIFVTHMHGDHVFGLMGLLLSVGCTGETRLIQVIGPPGLRTYLRRNLADTQSQMKCQYRVDELWMDPPPNMESDSIYLPLEVHGLNVRPRFGEKIWEVPSVDGKSSAFQVLSAPLKHTLEPCFGYVIQERDYPGRVQVTAELRNRLLSDENKSYLLKRGIQNPMTLLNELQHGHSVEVYDGHLEPSDIMSESKPGRRITILGDTCDSREIAKIAVGSDILVHECTNAFIEELDGRNNSKEEVEATTYLHGHSTPHTAGQFAQAVGTSHLILTHFSRRYKDDGSMESAMESIRNQCCQHFHGKVECAHDLERILVHLPKNARYTDANQAYSQASMAADKTLDDTREYVRSRGITLPLRSSRLISYSK